VKFSLHSRSILNPYRAGREILGGGYKGENLLQRLTYHLEQGFGTAQSLRITYVFEGLKQGENDLVASLLENWNQVVREIHQAAKMAEGREVGLLKPTSAPDKSLEALCFLGILSPIKTA
jgi:hypothetical protein